MRYASSLSLLVSISCLCSGVFGAAPSVITSTWYPAWLASSYSPDDVPWYGYNVVKYAFATTTSDPSVIGLSSDDEQLLPQFVSTAHQNGVSAFISIGGWTGSDYFSSSVGTASNRTKFVNAVLSLVSQYHLDGVDFDWEDHNEPNSGIGCASPSSCDSANFLSFLQQLRSAPAGKKLSITAAVYPTPFVGPNGAPLTDVSAYANVLDYVEIMAYNIWGPWSSAVGPGAPLNDTCTNQQHGSVVDSVRLWTQAKFPSNQLVLAVPSYGYSYFVAESDALQNGQITSYPPFDPSQQPQGDAWNTDSGIFDFWGLVQGGFLNAKGSAASGIHYRFDSCSQTPYVYNANSQVMVAYDDAKSFTTKGYYIVNSKLKGFSMWHSAGDYNNILLNSIRKAMNL
jgi:chitinase